MMLAIAYCYMQSPSIVNKFIFCPVNQLTQVNVTIVKNWIAIKIYNFLKKHNLFFKMHILVKR